MDDVDRPARRCLVGGRRGDDLADDLFPMASVGCCPQCGYGRPWSSLLTQKVASRRARGLVCMTLKSRGWTGGSIVSGFPLGASFAVSRRVCRNAAGVFVPRGVSLLSILSTGAIMCRTKITVQSGAERHPKDAKAAGRSALDGDLGRLKAGVPGGWPFPCRHAWQE